LKNKSLFIIFSIFFIFLAKIAIGQVNYEARNAHNDADNLFYDGKFEEALSEYKQLLEKYPNYDSKKQILMMIGRCYTNLGQDSLAVKSFQEIIDANPNDSYASQAVSLMGNLFRQRYQYKEAILVCDRVVKKHPKTLAASMAMYLIPTYLYYEGKIDQSIEGYKQFIEEFPTSPYKDSAFSNLVTLYINKREFEEAEQLILQNMKLNPNDTELMQELASVYQRQGKYKKAIQLYQSALKSNPNNTEILRDLGELYVETGQKQKAIQIWSKFSSGHNQYYHHQQLAYIYKQHGFYDEAIKEYEAAIKLQPRSSYLYTQLADVYKIQGQIDKIIDVYLDALIKLGITYGSRTNIISDMAEIFSGKQKQELFADVVMKIKEHLAEEPDNPIIWLTLAEIHFYQGDYESSLESFRKFADLYPNDNGRFLENYAEMLAEEENIYALDFYKAIEEEFPNSPYKLRVQMRRAELNYKFSKLNDAISILEDITKRTRNLEAYLLLGKIQLYGLHDVVNAKSTYEKAKLFGASRSLEIHLRIAECEILLGNYEEALKILTNLIPNSIEAQKLIADLYFYKGELETSKEEYQKVVQASKNDDLTNDAIAQIALIDANSDYLGQPLSIYAKAQQLKLIGKTTEALDLYQSILEDFPKSAIVSNAIFGIANIYLEQGKTEKAISMHQKIIDSESPFAAEAQAKIADIYLERLDEQDKALQAYSKLVEKYPDSVFTTYARKKIDSMK